MGIRKKQMTKFTKNSRVCFIGDSITCANGYLSYIVDYYQKHFKDDNIKFFNCGMSGARSKHLLDAFDFDTASYNPTHAVIFMGVNDSERNLLANGRSPEIYNTIKTSFEGYKKNLDTMCKKLRDMGSEIILCTSIPLDEYSRFDTETLPGSFALMMGYAEHVRNYARENGYPVCDYLAYYTEILQSGAKIYSTDRVHPNDLGAWHIAKCFLANQGLDIGEKAALSDKTKEWHEKVYAYRYMLTAELFFLDGRYDMTFEDSRDIAIEAKNKEGDNPFFENLYNIFMENKPREAYIKSEMLNFI